MQSFLEEVLDKVQQQNGSLENLIFVLPSKRAGNFLKQFIATKNTGPIFLPEIYSIESFVEHIAGLKYASNTQQLFELYKAYTTITTGEKDDFYTFSKWAQTLLQDFNEIDRYLVDSKKIFYHLKATQELNHWSLQKEQTALMQNYLAFWDNLEVLHHKFCKSLLEQSIGHQGLVYRQASTTVQKYLNDCENKTHIFIGFNALNKAEEVIIQYILNESTSQIYWDLDPYFINDKIHDAGHFIRQHQSNWSYLKNNPVKGLKETYTSSKNINIIGVPKNVSQSKYIGNLLENIQAEKESQLANTAVVLADENLLNPLINAIPESVSQLNITMGHPLGKSIMASLIENLFELYTNYGTKGWFYKDILTVLSHPFVQLIFTINNESIVTSISRKITLENSTYVMLERLMSYFPKQQEILSLLFFEVSIKPEKFLEKLSALMLAIKPKFNNNNDALNLEYSYRFYQLLTEIAEVARAYPYINDLKSLHGLYKELLSKETLDYQGEALTGLQVMGMLESRNLDFETVILSSVNEGILPAGKSSNSYIPFDVKIAYGLPTYKNKDAVYTYHFYRLLQRAKNVYLIYNTEPDVLEGGEKSRLLLQLLADDIQKHNITQIIASPKIISATPSEQKIEKDANLLERIKELAIKGFSPSSLSNYIRNPIDFYKKSILKIHDVEAVEEMLAANTFGTIVHDSLEDLYMPLVGKIITTETLNALKPKIKGVVLHHFKKSYKDGNINSGKNLIAFNVIEHYIEKFIALEKQAAKNNEIKLLALEQDFEMTLAIPEISYPIVLKGKLDRIDEKDGFVRIIDYKTGKVEARDVKITQWETLITDYKKSKAFQLLCYALMYTNKHPNQTTEAHIISFKNLSAGNLPFTNPEKNMIIDQATLNNFFTELKKLILEICDSTTPFVEKEV